MKINKDLIIGETNTTLGDVVKNIQNNTTLTTEPVLIGKWVDGSDLYRRIYTFTASGGSTTEIKLEEKLSSIVYFDGIGIDSSGTRIKLNQYRPDYADVLDCKFMIRNKGTIWVVPGSSLNLTCYVIIWYKQ